MSSKNRPKLFKYAVTKHIGSIENQELANMLIALSNLSDTIMTYRSSSWDNIQFNNLHALIELFPNEFKTLALIAGEKLPSLYVEPEILEISPALKISIDFEKEKEIEKNKVVVEIPKQRGRPKGSALAFGENGAVATTSCDGCL